MYPLTKPTATELLQEINQWGEEKMKVEGEASAAGKRRESRKIIINESKAVCRFPQSKVDERGKADRK